MPAHRTHSSEAPYELPYSLAGRSKVFRAVLRNDACGYCGARPAGTVDHIQPRSAGGDNTVGNLSGTCEFCNQEKEVRSLLHFLLERRETTR